MVTDGPRKLDAHQVDIITRAAFHRGAIITSYAQVEFLLADLVLRWRTQRGGEEGRLPYSLDARIKTAREVIDTDDRFAQYRSQVAGLIEGLKPFRKMRDMMAHGMLIVTTDSHGQHQLEYRMFRVAKGGAIETGYMTTDLDQLAYGAAEIAKYSQSFVTLWRRIYLDQGLEPVV